MRPLLLLTCAVGIVSGCVRSPRESLNKTNVTVLDPPDASSYPELF